MLIISIHLAFVALGLKIKIILPNLMLSLLRVEKTFMFVSSNLHHFNSFVACPSSHQKLKSEEIHAKQGTLLFDVSSTNQDFFQLLQTKVGNGFCNTRNLFKPGI